MPEPWPGPEPDELVIENDGPAIVRTNYWDIAAAKAGKVYLSVNAGVFRLLVPPARERDLAEMKTAEGAAVSRGDFGGYAGITGEGVEVLFDDGSNRPFTLHLNMLSLQSVPPREEAGRRVVLAVWTRGPRGEPVKAMELPCTFRLAKRMPDLRPWDAV
jgi:hypothetical protein